MRHAEFAWIDGAGCQHWVRAGTVHQGDFTLPRILARKVTPAAALALLGIVYGDLA